MKANFDRCLALLFGDEGGYANDPHDNGGPTNFGITQKVLNEWRAEHGVPTEPVRGIKRAEAADIYRAEFWNAVRGDDLPAGVDYLVFDGGVHSGPARSVRWLQQMLGTKADGAIGPVTLAAAGEAPAVAIIRGIQTLRMAFLRDHEDWPVYKNGWTTRVDSVVKDALAMVSAAPSAPIPQPKPAPPAAPARPSGLMALIITIINWILRRKSA